VGLLRLLIAAPARHCHWEPVEAAPGLKTIEDATEIRRRILIGF
jgi:hypothetical protein